MRAVLLAGFAALLVTGAAAQSGPTGANGGPSGAHEATGSLASTLAGLSTKMRAVQTLSGTGTVTDAAAKAALQQAQERNQQIVDLGNQIAALQCVPSNATCVAKRASLIDQFKKLTGTQQTSMQSLQAQAAMMKQLQDAIAQYIKQLQDAQNGVGSNNTR